MRVLQLISSAGFFGAESVLLELSLKLADLGHEVIVGAFDNGRPNSLALADIARARGLPCRVFACSGALDLATVGSIARMVETDRVDIVHTHNYKSNIYAALLRRNSRRALVSTCHNWIDASAKMRLYGRLDRLILRRFDAVVPVSANVRSRLVRAGFPESDLTIIENGIDTAPYGKADHREVTRREFGFTADDFVMGAIARLSEEKGHLALLQALQTLVETAPRCRLLVVGDGPLRNELESAARRLGVARNVVFLGQRNDVPRLLSALDLFVLPSKTEAQPMSLLEAMAAGVPAVATAVGDVPQMLGKGAFGTLIEPGNVEQIVAAVTAHLAGREASATRARAAQVDVNERRTSTHMAHAYLALYGQLLGGGSTGTLHEERRVMPGVHPSFSKGSKPWQ